MSVCPAMYKGWTTGFHWPYMACGSDIPLPPLAKAVFALWEVNLYLFLVMTRFYFHVLHSKLYQTVLFPLIFVLTTETNFFLFAGHIMYYYC